MEPWVIQAGILGLVAVVGYFLRQKDAAQEKQITTLWAKHDEDVRQLQELRERIAGKHYERGELDQKFDRLEQTFSSGLEKLGTKFDNLATALMKDRA